MGVYEKDEKTAQQRGNEKPGAGDKNSQAAACVSDICDRGRESEKSGGIHAGDFSVFH